MDHGRPLSTGATDHLDQEAADRTTDKLQTTQTNKPQTTPTTQTARTDKPQTTQTTQRSTGLDPAQ